MNKLKSGSPSAEYDNKELEGQIDRLKDAYLKTFNDETPYDPGEMKTALFNISVGLFLSGADNGKFSKEILLLKKMYEFFNYIEYGKVD